VILGWQNSRIKFANSNGIIGGSNSPFQIQSAAQRRAKLSAARLRRGEAGFTLVEMIISSSLMVLILAGAYVCLHAGIAGRKLIEVRSDLAQNARVALALISADLRAATPLSSDFEFLGMERQIDDVEADNIDFATHNYTPAAAHQADFCEVSYYVSKNQESQEYSLWRRRDPSPDPEPLEGGARDEIIQGVRGFKLEFYDGFEWFDEWGDPQGKRRDQNALLSASNLSGMPEAVRITLLLAPKAARKTEEPDKTAEPPQAFQTIVRLNLTPIASTLTTRSSSSSTSSQPQNNANPGQSGQNLGGPN
jgi:general secretion pathway protein J